jgi:hypothetical protein
VSATDVSRSPLPALPLDEWEPTKTTLHLWSQVVGKIRMASTPPRNHWWHVALYLDVWGLTTRRMYANDATTFEIVFDFIEHRLLVRTNRGDAESFELSHGLSVAEFQQSLYALLDALGIDVAISEMPYGVPGATPFRADREHSAYDRHFVEHFWRILDWTEHVFEEFAGCFCGKTSPVHLFWHSFDLALTRFGGGRAPARRDADPVTREAYSHEAVSFGFWPGDQQTREPMYYSYTAPEPEHLRESPLRPEQAFWSLRGSGSLALLPYEEVRHAADPKTALLDFLESTYRAGADGLHWDRADLESSWCRS